MVGSPLLRPSSLARFWGLNHKTVIDWIRAGTLRAVRSPGGHHRLRAEDVRDLCARQALPVPPFAQTDLTRIVLAGVGPGGRRVVERALGGRRVALAGYASAVEGVLAAARDLPAVVALDAGSAEVDADAAVRALRKVDGLQKAVIVVFNAATPKRADGHARSGADHVVLRTASRSRAPLGRALAAIILE